MKYMAFESIDDLFRFVLCHRAANGRVPAWCTSVLVTAKDYRLGFFPSDWDESGDRFGGKIVSGTEEVRSLTVSELLEHVLLQRVSTRFNSGASSIVLAVPVDAPAAQQSLYDAWRQVERVEWARSAFYSVKNPGGGWQAVQIDGIAPGFDFEKFRQANRSKLTDAKKPMRVFAPAQSSGGSSLFVEWEYRYPRPNEFSLLHRDASSPLVLCTADREAETRDGRRAWWVPEWHAFGVANYVSVSDLVKVEPLEEVHCVHYEQDEQGLNQVALLLEIRPLSESMVSVRDLESRIGVLKRELEILASKHERFERAEFQEYFPIYCWRQEPGREALPSGLEHMLGRPLNELARYLYLQTRDEEGVIIHYVAGQDHETAGLASAVACDELYLCDTRWLHWRLPLFVRQGAALTIDINEEEMAAKVREVLPAEPPANPDLRAGESFCLAQPGGDNGHPAFVWLTFCMTLNEAVAITNGHAEGLSKAVGAAGFEAGAAALSQDVAVSVVAQQLDATTRNRTEQQLREGGGSWESARRNLQAAAFQVRLAELAIRPMIAARDAFPQSWSEFVQRTLEADAAAVKFKIEALKQWADSEPSRMLLLRAHEAGLTDISRIIEQRRKEYEQILPRVQEFNKKLAQECAELDKKREALSKALGELDQRKQRLEEANAALDRQNGALEGMLRTTESEIARHKDLRRKLEQSRALCQQLEQTLAHEKSLFHQELDAVERGEAHITHGTKALARAGADLERRIAELEECIHACELRIRTHVELRERTAACELRYEQAEQALEGSQGELRTVLAELRSKLRAGHELEAKLAARLSAGAVNTGPETSRSARTKKPRFWPFIWRRRH